MKERRRRVETAKEGGRMGGVGTGGVGAWGVCGAVLRYARWSSGGETQPGLSDSRERWLVLL